ncbi:unnamed protein product [Schistosoma mattheei]|uniref:Uncharacterized protein n=1 Tax=Schistosoma mattheei TaxID=31246 RepID=A0A183NI10_9TREM|nr:unnamed protein product [Schistosoma mattheei]
MIQWLLSNFLSIGDICDKFHSVVNIAYNHHQRIINTSDYFVHLEVQQSNRNNNRFHRYHLDILLNCCK